MIKHKIINGICVNCGKTIDLLFIELVDSGDKEAGRAAFNALSSNYFIDYNVLQIRLVEEKHTKCLTDDEFMIKDIIE